jgi:dTDP-4-amino-4,6-dideoxygalactose transaminase
MDWRVPLADLDYGQEEEEAVLKVIRSKWLTMGEVTKEFEAKFANRIGVKHAFAVSNATEALHLACLALGIGPGDEVITPSLSFVATSNAVLYTGAEVRFADVIGPSELTIDPDEIVRQITPKTKAIIVMHYAGYPCRMDEIMSVADRYGLPVIEDAAHAPGASLNNKAIGTWGALGCFSFFSNKNLSTGEGGMITTNHDDYAGKICLWRSHGMTTLTYDRHKGHAYSYDVVDLGFNYRIDEIRSALGIVQLGKLDTNNALRRLWTERYWQKLSNLGVKLPFNEMQHSRTNCISSYHIFPMLLPAGLNREAFIDRLREERIQTSIHYPPTHRFTYYMGRYGENALPYTEEIADREVTLPLYPGMGEHQVDLVVETIQRALEAA